MLCETILPFVLLRPKILNGFKVTPFATSISSRKFDIIYYYIDSLNVNVHKPMSTTNDTLYIQDYIHRYMNYYEDTEDYDKKLKLIQYLETKGVDFKNYRFKNR